MARVDPDGAVTEVVDGLRFPNGTVITPDGATLIVGETVAARFTAFTIAGPEPGRSRRGRPPSKRVCRRKFPPSPSTRSACRA